MAFFKSRQSDDVPAATDRQADNVDVLRRRAKHRLIGAVVLVLAGVVGFPLLFDSQPRPVPVDVQIDMPDKAKVAPLQIPAAQESSQAPAKLAQTKPTVLSNVVPAASLGEREQLVGKASESKPEAKPEVKPASKPEAKPETKPATKPDDGARAKALLDGKAPSKDSAKPAAKDKAHEVEGRFVVQVGAFTEGGKAHEVRLKLEHAGLKTYTHVAETKDGKLIRVRLGPFSTRAEADKAAGKVKQLQLSASVLSL